MVNVNFFFIYFFLVKVLDLILWFIVGISIRLVLRELNYEICVVLEYIISFLLLLVYLCL